eukprot:1139442-Pelagomonas_calceolata.AAC.7
MPAWMPHHSLHLLCINTTGNGAPRSSSLLSWKSDKAEAWLGSNLLVHYLGLHAADPPPYAAAICVSNAFDLERGEWQI